MWAPILGGVSVLTMTLGNFTALQQRNMVRLLAYSSVAHAGYMLLPFAVVQPGNDAVNGAAFTAVLVYLLAYAAMNIGAFACVTGVASQRPGRLLSDYAGLGSHSPGLALGLTVFLLSLGGVLPVLVGFWAKLYILQATVIQPTAGNLVLAAALVINSVVATYYYLRVAWALWMSPSVDDRPVRPGFALNFSIAALSAIVLVVGVAPQMFAGYAERSTLIASP